MGKILLDSYDQIDKELQDRGLMDRHAMIGFLLEVGQRNFSNGIRFMEQREKSIHQTKEDYRQQLYAEHIGLIMQSLIANAPMKEFATNDYLVDKADEICGALVDKIIVRKFK